MLAMNSADPANLDSAHDAWRFAADEATDALHAWLSSPASARTASFDAYRAALDREEQAARTLAHHSR
jgi:hypothetical protein